MDFNKASDALLSVYGQLLQEHSNNLTLDSDTAHYAALHRTLDTVHNAIVELSTFGRLATAQGQTNDKQANRPTTG